MVYCGGSPGNGLRLRDAASPLGAVLEFLKNLLLPRPQSPPVDIVKRFDLIGRVGQGSMSKVWRARDTKTGRIVALKVLDLKKTRAYEARFVGRAKPSEGEIAVRLEHRYIVPTFEYGVTTRGEQFLVMEFIEGESFTVLMELNDERTRANRLRWLIELAEAIGYIHAQKLIHRDINPRNVVVSRDDDHVRLIDFGLAVPNSEAFQAPGNRTGVIDYMAPELVRRQKTDERIDQFSFAVTAYEFYAGRRPWRTSDSLDVAVQHINSPPTPLLDAAPQTDPDLAAAIMRGIERDPEARWPSMHEFSAALSARVGAPGA